MGVGLFALALERKRAVETRLIARRHRLEARGVEYATGFLANDQGRAPQWFLKFKRGLRELLGVGLALEAAYQYLADSGVDPYACGREFYR